LKSADERLQDLKNRVASGEAKQISDWFRRLGNTPASLYVTPRARRQEAPTQRDHLVPVRVFVHRLLRKTMNVGEVPEALRMVTCLHEEHSFQILKMMGKSGRTEVFRALLACPPKQLPRVASWRYLSQGIPLIGVDGTPRIALADRSTIQAMVKRYAADYGSGDCW
jgi:hypothetical protein